MAQMVLPHNLSKSGGPDSGSDLSPTKPRSDKAGESRFDEVSQAERRRMDEARALKTEATQPNKHDEVSKNGENYAASPSEEGADHGTTKETGTAATGQHQSDDHAHPDGETVLKGEQAVGRANAEKEQTEAIVSASQAVESDALLAKPEAASSETAETAEVAITFAGLQALASEPASAGMMKAASVAAAPAQAKAQGNPFLQGALAGMTSVSGKNGPMGATLASQGSATKLALSEALIAGGLAETGKSSDSPLLQNAIRFQGALDMVNPQTSALNGSRLAPETAVLRGYATSIDVPVSHAEWGDKMAGKLTWLTARNMSVAEIHLTPPDMGPMEVKVRVQQDQANITVHSANPVVREQLELHSHRLRDMLSEQGFSLEQFDVSDSGGQAQNGEADEGHHSDGPVVAGQDDDDGSVQVQSLDLTWKGEVDIFA